MQNESRPTPGPWATSHDAVPEGITQITVYAEGDGKRVATVFSEADARLFEAAPDLLDACTALLDYAVDPAQWSSRDVAQFIEAGREAIAKAEGGNHE